MDNRPYRIYIIEEDAENNNDIGYNPEWRKIGIAVLSDEDNTIEEFNLLDPHPNATTPLG